LPHFVPDAAERVVGEELDNVARGEKLVADSELVTVARRLGLGPHLSPLLVAVEALIDPADGFVFVPDCRRSSVVGRQPGKVRIVQDIEQLLKRLTARPEQAGWVAAVEEHTHLTANLVEEALDVEPVAVIWELGKSRCEASELLEACRLLAAGNALLHQPTGFEHLEGHKAVQCCECRLA
jgi:hypothetical protein